MGGCIFKSTTPSILNISAVLIVGVGNISRLVVLVASK